MKVTGPGQPPTPGAEGAPPAGAAKSERADSPEKALAEKAPEGKKSFAEKMSGPRTTTAVAATAPVGKPAGEVVVRDLAADLRSGKVDARTTVDKLVDRVLAVQLGPEAPAGVRDTLRATLRDAVETDPVLADKLRQLA
jgi:hypothetical protein